MVGPESQGVTARVARAATAWAALEGALGSLNARHDDANADRMQDLLDEIQEAHAAASRAGSVPAGLTGLLSFLTEWVMAYEAVHEAIEPADPVDLLKFLMAENKLRQADLAKELGGQPVVSEILNRNRKINARQARELGRRFNMSAGAFIEDPTQNFEDDQADELHAVTASPCSGARGNFLSATPSNTAVFEMHPSFHEKQPPIKGSTIVPLDASSAVGAYIFCSADSLQKALLRDNGSAATTIIAGHFGGELPSREIRSTYIIGGSNIFSSAIEMDYSRALQ